MALAQLVPEPFLGLKRAASECLRGQLEPLQTRRFIVKMPVFWIIGFRIVMPGRQENCHCQLKLGQTAQDQAGHSASDFREITL